MNWSNNSDEPSAPPLPEARTHGSYDSYVEPNWVRQMYGTQRQQTAPRIDQRPSGISLPPAQQSRGHQEPIQPTAAHPTYDMDTIVYVHNQQQQGPNGNVVRPSAPAHLLESGGSTGEGARQPQAAKKPAKLDRSAPLKHKASDEQLNDAEEGGIPADRPDSEPQPYVPPSWADALCKRHQKQLRNYSKDVFGVPVPSTARPFSMFASPLQIGETCSGLGVYFSTIATSIILLLMLTACYLYPLIDNATHQRWATEYDLFVKDERRESAVCSKGWDVSSWMTETTPGGHCASTKYSSSYDCAARCTWSPSRLSNPICASQPLPTWFDKPAGQRNRTTACRQHLPCSSDQTDPTAPDGPCYCCTMELDLEVIETNPNVSTGQLWMFFVGQLVFLCWTLFLIHTQLRAVHTVGSRILGVSDYSVLIKGIPRKRADDAPLAHWCAQFGTVVSAFNVPSVGDALRAGNRVSNLLVNKAESEALLGSSSWNPMQWVYRMLIVGNHRKLLTRLEREKLKLEIYERQESEPTGQGIATFEYTDSAAACVADFDLPPIRKAVDYSLCGYTSTNPKLHGAIVNVSRAPEPSDIIWEHTNCTGTRAFFRRLWSWTLTAAIILVGAGVQYGIAVLANNLRVDRMMAEYSAATGSPEAVEEAHDKAARLRATSIVAAAMVVVVNLSIAVLIRKLALYERWTTRSSMERSVMVKLAVSQLLNSFAAPVLATYASGNKASWYSRGGLSEAAFWTQLGMSMIPPLMHLLAPGNLINKLLLAKFARTQDMLDRLLAPPEFWLAEQHAAAVNTLGLSVLYAPMLPISPLIAAAGLTVAYWSNKYFALRVAAAPGNVSGQAQSSLNLLLRLLPLLQLILMKYLYFKNHPGMPAVFITGLAFWLLFMMAPIRHCLGVFTRRRPITANGLSYYRLHTGVTPSPEIAEVYAPKVPTPCSKVFKQMIAETFAHLSPEAYLSVMDVAEDVAPMSPKIADQAGGRYGGYAQATLRGSLVGGIKEALRIMWDPNETEDLVHPPPAEEGRPTLSGGGGNGDGLVSPGVDSAGHMPRSAYSTTRGSRTDSDGSDKEMLPGSLRATYSQGGGRSGDVCTKPPVPPKVPGRSRSGPGHSTRPQAPRPPAPVPVRRHASRQGTRGPRPQQPIAPDDLFSPMGAAMMGSAHNMV